MIAPLSDDEEPLNKTIARTKLDTIAAGLKAEPSLRLMQIERKPNQIIVSRSGLSVEFTFMPNIGDVSNGKAVIAAVFYIPNLAPQQLPIVTSWDVAEFVDRLKRLQDLVPNRADAVKRLPIQQVAIAFGIINHFIDNRLAGVTGNVMKVEGTKFTVLMVQRGERHTFSYVDRGSGKAAIEVRTTKLKAPMEERRLPDIRVWDPEQFLDVLAGNLWSQGIVEEQ